MTHEWDDIFAFCKRCGKSQQDVEDRQSAECHASGNVVGVSHRIALKLAKEIYRRQVNTETRS